MTNSIFIDIANHRISVFARDKNQRTTLLYETTFEQPLSTFENQISSLLNEAFAKIKQRHRFSRPTINVILSDLFFQHRIFSFDALPDSPQAITTLTERRFFAETYLEPQHHHVAHQSFNKTAPYYIWTSALKSELRKTLHKKAEQNGLMISSITSQSIDIFNKYRTVLKTSPGSLLSISQDCVSLIIWTAQGIPCFTHQIPLAQPTTSTTLLNQLIRFLKSHELAHEESLKLYIHDPLDLVEEQAFQDFFPSRLSAPLHFKQAS